MKHSVTQKLLTDAANHVASKRGIEIGSSSEEICIPKIKNVSYYESALDKAVRTLIEYGAEDDMLAIIKDAKENKKMPTEYKTNGIENVRTYSLFFREVKLVIKKGNKVSMKFYSKFGSITITPIDVTITKQVVINNRLGDFIKTMQKCLDKIEKELKKD